MNTKVKIVYIHALQPALGKMELNVKYLDVIPEAVKFVGKNHNPNMLDTFKCSALNCTINYRNVVNQTVTSKTTLKGFEAYGYCFPDSQKALRDNIEACIKGREDLFTY